MCWYMYIALSKKNTYRVYKKIQLEGRAKYVSVDISKHDRTACVSFKIHGHELSYKNIKIARFKGHKFINFPIPSNETFWLAYNKTISYEFNFSYFAKFHKFIKSKFR